MMTQFGGRVAMVTGAGSGIGRACAVRLSQEGATILLHGRTASKLTETSTLLPGPFATLPGDLSQPRDNEKVADEVQAHYNHLDILVNSAGIGDLGAADRLEWDDFQRMLDNNLVGLFDLTRRLAPVLRASEHGGSVINISSTLGLTPVAKTLAYSAAKAGVIALTETLAAEWGPHIRVNCVCPGIVNTPMQYRRGRPKEQVREWLAAMAARHPLKRIGGPEDIAAVVAFLASQEASWITGATLVVDGGLTVARQ
ncbi:MAG: SDR family oxidoreductase [Candidatus Zixiibacteriota bacterium]